MRVGIDIIEISRVEAVVARRGERFLHRIYTDRELELCHDRGEALAACFSAKEAVMKVLGMGAKDIGWREIEILADQRGAPEVHLTGRARERAAELGLGEIAISLSHSKEYAVASAVAEKSA